LEEHELALLRQAVRVADVCDDLQAVVDAEGPLTANRLGERKAHPALTEIRQQRLVLARLLVALRVPLGEQEDEERPGRRSQRRGVRGFYAVGRRREAAPWGPSGAAGVAAAV
jgi:hypothetical protein